MSNVPRTGGRILVDALRVHGVDLVFGIPGESYLPVLDALHDTPEVRFVTCRRAWSADATALIELRIDPEATSPRASLSAIRASALATGLKN